MHLNYQTKQSHDGAKFELVSNEVNDKDNKLAHEIHEQDEFERLLFDGADALRKVGSHMNAKETLAVCSSPKLLYSNVIKDTNSLSYIFQVYIFVVGRPQIYKKSCTGSGQSRANPSQIQQNQPIQVQLSYFQVNF